MSSPTEARSYSRPRPPTLSAALVSPLALMLGLAAPALQASDYIVDTTINADDRCTSVSNASVSISRKGGSATAHDVVWRTGEDALDIGGVTQFSAWGNFDLATRITLTGIPGASLREMDDRRGGPANSLRGCGARGSVNLQIITQGYPSTPVRGRLRFEFPTGPFDIAVVHQPVPNGMDFRWPAQPRGGVNQGEHHDCLRTNGGHVKVVGDLLEIGLNPNSPLPQGCNVFSLEGFALRDARDLTSTVSFSGSGDDPNVAVTRVTGLPASLGFAVGKRERLQGFNALLHPQRPASSAPFPALEIDYTAAAAALRARPNIPGAALAVGVSPQRSRLAGNVTRFGVPVPSRPSAPTPEPVPRTIDFQLALDSFNNVTGLHTPMRVRLVETGQVAASNLAADFDVDTVCSDTSSIVVKDTSTSGLAITRRELQSGDGQVFRAGSERLSQRITYRSNGRYTLTLAVTDASGNTRTVEKPVNIPRQACPDVSPPPTGIIIIGGNSQPNLLPSRMFEVRPLLRQVGGLNGNLMVPITFCSALGNNARGEVAVPELTWGVSSAREPSATVRSELRNAATGAVLSTFDSGPISANAAPVTRSNYAGRPARIGVVNVTGGDRMVEYGNQTGCFLDKDLPTPALDPAAFLLVVDTQNAVDEGTDGERDNELRF